MKSNHYQHKVYGMGHTRLRRIIELAGLVEGKRILDVGCAAGRLGAILKEGGAQVIGVEISEDAAAQARKVLDRVYEFDIEGQWPREIGTFDLVLLPEILEHVFDPEAVLRSVRTVLKDDGAIIITTPNFMTWTNRLRFLFGRFAYKSEGMFDFGHIRWFTYRYLKEVLAITGFKFVAERHIIFPGKLTRLLKYLPGIFAFQFVVKATKR